MKQNQPTSQKTTGPPIHVMAKPIGPTCNINCEYCYYLDKSNLYPTTKKFRMSDEVLECFIRDFIDTQIRSGTKQIAFAWQGGEPTILGVDYFRNILRLQKKYCPKDAKIENSIQTNGMFLDDNWAAFLKDNGFLVGISIDGPKKLHDRYRRDRAGRPTFDDVMRGLEVLQTAGVQYNALTVLNRHNVLKPRDIYGFLRGAGIEFIQFIPIVERFGADGTLAPVTQLVKEGANPLITPWSVSPDAYGKFLCDVFDIWIKRDVGRVFVQFFDVQLGLWMGEPSGLCVFAETCGPAVALEHNGDLFTCDHFVFPEYRLGNVTEEHLSTLAWSEKQQAFGQSKKDDLPNQCQQCGYLFACNGGCPKHRFLESGDGQKNLNYFCRSHMRFFKHAGSRLNEMAGLLRAGKPAADIMQIRAK